MILAGGVDHAIGDVDHPTDGPICCAETGCLENQKQAGCLTRAGGRTSLGGRGAALGSAGGFAERLAVGGYHR